MKAVYDKHTANIILNSENMKPFPVNLEQDKDDHYYCYHLPFLDISIPKNRNKYIKIGKKKTVLSFNSLSHGKVY